MTASQSGRRLAVGLVLVLGLGLPPVARVLEADMVGHVVVQLPLLVLAGWLIGTALGTATGVRALLDDWNAAGIPGLLTALFTALFWMLPRSLDQALVDPATELAKFASMALLIGLPLSLSWPRLPAILRGFVWAQLVSMLAILGWLYLDAPVRLCNSYLIGQQVMLGRVLLAISTAIALYWTGHLFFRGAGGAQPRRWSKSTLQENSNA